MPRSRLFCPSRLPLSRLHLAACNALSGPSAQRGAPESQCSRNLADDPAMSAYLPVDSPSRPPRLRTRTGGLLAAGSKLRKQATMSDRRSRLFGSSVRVDGHEEEALVPDSGERGSLASSDSRSVAESASFKVSEQLHEAEAHFVERDPVGGLGKQPYGRDGPYFVSYANESLDWRVRGALFLAQLRLLTRLRESQGRPRHLRPLSQPAQRLASLRLRLLEPEPDSKAGAGHRLWYHAFLDPGDRIKGRLGKDRVRWCVPPRTRSSLISWC